MLPVNKAMKILFSTPEAIAIAPAKAIKERITGMKVKSNIKINCQSVLFNPKVFIIFAVYFNLILGVEARESREPLF